MSLAVLELQGRPLNGRDHWDRLEAFGFDWRAHWMRPADSRPFELEHVYYNLSYRVVVVSTGLSFTEGIESEGM